MTEIKLTPNQLMRLVKDSHALVEKHNAIIKSFSDLLMKDPYNAMDNSLRIFESAAFVDVARGVIRSVQYSQSYADEHNEEPTYNDLVGWLLNGVLYRRGLSDEGTANLANTARQKACSHFLREYFRDIPLMIKYS